MIRAICLLNLSKSTQNSGVWIKSIHRYFLWNMLLYPITVIYPKTVVYPKYPITVDKYARFRTIGQLVVWLSNGLERRYWMEKVAF